MGESLSERKLISSSLMFFFYFFSAVISFQTLHHKILDLCKICRGAQLQIYREFWKHITGNFKDALLIFLQFRRAYRTYSPDRQTEVGPQAFGKCTEAFYSFEVASAMFCWASSILKSCYQWAGSRESDESGSIQMIQKGGVQYESQTELGTKEKLLTEGQNKSMDLPGSTAQH